MSYGSATLAYGHRKEGIKSIRMTWREFRGESMRIGLKVNPGTWEEASQWATIAEEAGFDGLWTGDNMRNPRDPAVPVHDGPTIIAGWAATTSRIRVGLLIAN